MSALPDLPPKVRPALTLVGEETKLCGKCRLVKPVSEFYLVRRGESDGPRHHICKPCSVKGVREYRRRARENGGRLGRKRYQLGDDHPCGRCGEVKPWTPEHYYVAKRDGRGSIARLDSWCKPCRREEVKRIAAQKDREEFLSHRRALREAAARDPAWRERQRKNGRAHLRRKREREREETVPMPRRVPARPLAAAMLQAADLLRTDETPDPVGTIAFRCGIPKRTLYAWHTGERAEASAEKADAALIGLGLLWWEVFDPALAPDLYSPLEWCDVVDTASRVWAAERLLADRG